MGNRLQTIIATGRLLRRLCIAALIAISCVAPTACESARTEINASLPQENIEDPELAAKRAILSAVLADLLNDGDLQLFLVNWWVNKESNVISLRGWPTIDLPNNSSLQLQYLEAGAGENQSPPRMRLTLDEFRLDLAKCEWDDCHGLAFPSAPIRFQAKRPRPKGMLGENINLYYDYKKVGDEWHVQFCGAR